MFDADCPSALNGYLCTRNRWHPGPHEAGGGGGKVICWWHRMWHTRRHAFAGDRMCHQKSAAAPVVAGAGVCTRRKRHPGLHEAGTGAGTGGMITVRWARNGLKQHLAKALTALAVMIVLNAYSAGWVKEHHYWWSAAGYFTYVALGVYAGRRIRAMRKAKQPQAVTVAPGLTMTTVTGLRYQQYLAPGAITSALQNLTFTAAGTITSMQNFGTLLGDCPWEDAGGWSLADYAQHAILIAQLQLSDD